MEKLKILIIEDTREVCDFLKSYLDRCGTYQTAIAHTGEEGMKKTLQERFDLVILDYYLPGICGDVILRKLKKKFPSTSVVLSSIYHDNNDILGEEVKRSADGLLRKPFSIEELRRELDRCLPARAV